jgi:hypothetical protein
MIALSGFLFDLSIGVGILKWIAASAVGGASSTH